jgi:RimJ/RimL family protein N-acetyltransferase
MALVPDRDDPASAEVGVLLLPDAQGQGHATEAIAALADSVFAVPGLQKLWTRHASGHAAAVGLMRRLGFVAGPEAGAQSRWHLLRGTWPPSDPVP